MLQEVHVLRLRHRNLVNFHHVWLENSQLTPFGPPVPTLYLLQEVPLAFVLKFLIQFSIAMAGI
jgi:hypothetical protein